MKSLYPYIRVPKDGTPTYRDDFITAERLVFYHSRTHRKVVLEEQYIYV